MWMKKHKKHIRKISKLSLTLLLLKITKQCLVTNCMTCITSSQKPICDLCEEGYKKNSQIGENKEIFDTCIKQKSSNVALILLIIVILCLFSGFIIWFLVIKIWLVNPNKAQIGLKRRENVKIERKNFKNFSRKNQKIEETERDLVVTTERGLHPMTPIRLENEIIVNKFKEKNLTPKKNFDDRGSTASGDTQYPGKKHNISFTPGRVTKFIQNALKNDEKKFKKKKFLKNEKNRNMENWKNGDFGKNEKKNFGGNFKENISDFQVQVSKVILNMNDIEVNQISERKKRDLELSDSRKKSLLETRKRIFDSQSGFCNVKNNSEKKILGENPYLKEFEKNENLPKNEENPNFENFPKNENFQKAGKNPKIKKIFLDKKNEKKIENLELKESPKFLLEGDINLNISSEDEEENLFKKIKKISPEKSKEIPITLSSYISSPQKVRIFEAPKKFEESQKKNFSPLNKKIEDLYTKKITSRACSSDKEKIEGKKFFGKTIVNERFITKEEFDRIKKEQEMKKKIFEENLEKKNFEKNFGNQEKIENFKNEENFSFDRKKIFNNNEENFNYNDSFDLNQRPILANKRNSPSIKNSPKFLKISEKSLRKIEIQNFNKKNFQKNFFKKPELKPEDEKTTIVNKIRIEGDVNLRSRSVNNYPKLKQSGRKRSKSVQREPEENFIDPFLKKNEKKKYDSNDILKFKIDIPSPKKSKKPSKIGGNDEEIEDNFMEKSSENSINFDKYGRIGDDYKSDDYDFSDNEKKPEFFSKNLPLIVEESDEYEPSGTISGLDFSIPKYYKYDISSTKN